MNITFTFNLFHILNSKNARYFDGFVNQGFCTCGKEDSDTSSQGEHKERYNERGISDVQEVVWGCFGACKVETN